MKQIHCGRSLIDDTLLILREAGQQNQECVVFWLAPNLLGPVITIKQILRPEQRAAEDYFSISAESMREIMGYLKDNRLFLAAQVHSHPKAAFHSAADDEWAIVRHTGALSIVIPDFAVTTTSISFLQQSAIFSLHKDDIWLPVPLSRLPYLLVIK